MREPFEKATHIQNGMQRQRANYELKGSK